MPTANVSARIDLKELIVKSILAQVTDTKPTINVFAEKDMKEQNAILKCAQVTE